MGIRQVPAAAAAACNNDDDDETSARNQYCLVWFHFMSFHFCLISASRGPPFGRLLSFTPSQLNSRPIFPTY